jgi:hypothetical protein
LPSTRTDERLEAAEDHAHEQVALIDEAAERAGSARGLIEIYVALDASGYTNWEVQGSRWAAGRNAAQEWLRLIENGVQSERRLRLS